MTISIVTGGAGFIGSHIVEELKRLDHMVIVIDNEYSDNDNFHWRKDTLNVNLDITDYKGLKNAFTGADYVFHLAAIVGGRLMIENNPLSVADDLSIDSELWQWVSETRPKKTICFSSSAAYPIKYQTEHNFKPLKESLICFDSDIGMPDMSYGWAKLTHEYLAKLAYEKNGISSRKNKFWEDIRFKMLLNLKSIAALDFLSNLVSRPNLF